MAYKSKHQPRWKEVGFGSVALFIASPLIAYALIYSIAAVIAGFSYLGQGAEFAPSLITAASLGVVGLTFGLWQVIQRFRQIARPQQQLNMLMQYDEIDDQLSSAERRLVDTPREVNPHLHKKSSERKYFIQG